VPIASVGDIELFYELCGDGRPLVLIPGLGTDSRLFWPIMAGLGDYRTLRFDPRGAGRSSKPDAPYSIAMLADDTAALMQAVDVPSACVLGVSMGGRIALELVLAHPAMVTRLVLVSTGARTLPYRRPSWRWFVMDVAPRLPGVARLDPQPRYAHERQRAASRDYDAAARLGRIETPTLIVHGRHDHVTPYRLAAELHQGITGSRLVTVAGGHLAPLTHQRSRLLAAIHEFARP